MKALVWHGKEDVRCDTVSDPSIEHERDAIVKVTSCAICGSDLHLFHNMIPAMLPGDIMGHEMMGEVVEVGSGVNGRLRKGERIVVPSPSFAASASNAGAATSRFARPPIGISIWPRRCSGTRRRDCSATLI
jgi:threonine dehydrogenase-like Zn-dependent dehydrogenase